MFLKNKGRAVALAVAAVLAAAVAGGWHWGHHQTKQAHPKAGWAWGEEAADVSAADSTLSSD